MVAILTSVSLKASYHGSFSLGGQTDEFIQWTVGACGVVCGDPCADKGWRMENGVFCRSGSSRGHTVCRIMKMSAGRNGV